MNECPCGVGRVVRSRGLRLGGSDDAVDSDWMVSTKNPLVLMLMLRFLFATASAAATGGWGRWSAWKLSTTNTRLPSGLLGFFFRRRLPLLLLRLLLLRLLPLRLELPRWLLSPLLLEILAWSLVSMSSASKSDPDDTL